MTDKLNQLMDRVNFSPVKPTLGCVHKSKKKRKIRMTNMLNQLIYRVNFSKVRETLLIVLF